MFIKNFEQLAISPLRKQARLIAEAGFSAVETRHLVRRALRYDAVAEHLYVSGECFDLQKIKRLVCVGFGKIAFEAASELQSILGEKISSGFVIDVRGGNLGRIVTRIGTHPNPTQANALATREMLGMLTGLSEQDMVICVVGGGGSALLCDPQDISCELQTKIVGQLTRAGATISEINTVRKHLSKVKGGHLAKIMYPAQIVSLIISDVPGNDLSVVASGPTVKDTTSIQEARAILEKYDTLKLCQIPRCNLYETPKEETYFERVRNFLIASPKTALLAMRSKAEDLGWETHIYSEEYEGEAKEMGKIVLKASQRGECLIGVGETTVTINTTPGDGEATGRGGRNQEMALAALQSIEANQVLVCLASDGYDNTDHAGAIVDALTMEKAQDFTFDPQTYLVRHDSYNFFKAIGDSVITGLTGSNVSDFFVLLTSAGPTATRKP